MVVIMDVVIADIIIVSVSFSFLLGCYRSAGPVTSVYESINRLGVRGVPVEGLT